MSEEFSTQGAGWLLLRGIGCPRLNLGKWDFSLNAFGNICVSKEIQSLFSGGRTAWESTLWSVTPSKSAFLYKFFSLSVSMKQIQRESRLSQYHVKKILSVLGFIAQSANTYLQD